MSERVLGVGEREALDRARTRMVALRAAQYRLLEDIAELETLGVAQQTGDRATRRLLQDLSTLDAHEATRLAEEAADLTPRRSLSGELVSPRLPCTAAVAAEGEVGPGHIAIIRTTMERLGRLETVSVEDWVAAERFLAGEATRLPPRMLQRAATRLVATFDPDGAAPPDGDDCRDELHVVRRKDGRLEFKGRLNDPVDGDVFLGAIDPLAEPCGPDDTRSLARRRADALKDVVEGAQRPGGVAAGVGDEQPGSDDDAPIPAPRRPGQEKGRPERPGRALLTITMDLRWLQLATGHGVLGSEALVDPRTVRRWACDAEVVPVVLGSRSEPLDVGRLQRTVTDAIRRALNIRDGGCAFPSCDRAPRRCHAHHIRYWFHGGSTCLDNLVLLCRFHHQLIHAGHWTVEIRDGLPWFTPPAWIDPDQQPRPGGRPRVPL
ncbi:DUF222 domain-containing protein [Actinomycetospora sp. CA-053990]|uniref:HNH endonuclease signature motif containing protein n=1 Tax=Actinomycetospora sp. CA-053990 TaxID=3239891 RepID=UPI003D8C089E